MSTENNSNGESSTLGSGINDDIQKAVNIGSIYLCLDENFFSPDSLIEWLALENVGHRTYIAYKALCSRMHPREHYLKDSYHILKKRPEYAPIAYYFGLCPEIPDRNVPDCVGMVIDHTCEILSSKDSESDTWRILSLIMGETSDLKFTEEHLPLCFESQIFPHIRSLSGHEYNEHLVRCDWILKLRHNDTLPSLLISRVKYLQQVFPSYYEKVVKKYYLKLSTDLWKEKLLFRLSREELAFFDKCFPGIVDCKILSYDTLCYKISLLSLEVAGYILGFPIQNVIPDEKYVNKALEILNRDGIANYVSIMRDYVDRICIPTTPFPNCTATYSNESDVTMEPVNNYTPFDIVAYQIGAHIYRFTRPEFPDLEKSRKNPWTNDWIPASVLSTIKSRVEAAKDMKLCPARPMEEMLDRLQQNKLFEEDIPLKPESKEETRDLLRQSQFSEMLSLLTQTSLGLSFSEEDLRRPFFFFTDYPQ